MRHITVLLLLIAVLTGCQQPRDLLGRLTSYGVTEVLITEPVNNKCGIKTDGTLSLKLSGCANTSRVQDGK